MHKGEEREGPHGREWRKAQSRDPWKDVERVAGPALTLVLLLGGLALDILAFVSGTGVSGENPVWWMFAVGVVGMILGFISFGGYFTLHPMRPVCSSSLVSTRGRQGSTASISPTPSTPTVQPARRVRRRGESPADEWDPGDHRQAGTSRTAPGAQALQDLLRARTLNMEKLKVNDKRGTPSRSRLWWMEGRRYGPGHV